MYVYQITNKINGKQYIGITNNYKRRWENHKCCNDPSMAIAQAIKKYGANNFDFEVLLSGLTIEEASEKEIELIKTKNTRVPNGYNIAAGGQYTIENAIHYGADNGRALLTEEEAQYIKDHRDQPMYVLYEEFANKITYDTFKKCYKHKTYKNLIPKVQEYPYNTSFSNQLACGKLEYDEIVELRNQYNNHVFWKDAYEQYQDRYTPTSFWRMYTGLSYKLIMPEVFTEENKKIHASLAKSGVKNGRAKLNEEDVRQIRKLAKDGVQYVEIYKLYPQITPTTVRDIIHKNTWKNIQED